MTEPRLADDAVGGIHRPCELQAYRGRLFLTVADVARVTDTDPRTVRRGIEAGDLPAIRINNTVRIPAAQFWALCGLDPETLRPLTTPNSSEPGSGEEPGPAVHSLPPQHTEGPHHETTP